MPRRPSSARTTALIVLRYFISKRPAYNGINISYIQSHLDQDYTTPWLAALAMSEPNPSAAPTHELPQFKPYTPLQYAPSKDVYVIYADRPRSPSPAHDENIPPVVPAPQSNHTMEQGSLKRRCEEEQHHMYGKRARQGIAPESFIPLSTAPAHPQSHNAMRYGTQHNPLEIDFSPGPQARHPPKAKYAPRARPNLPRDLRHAGLYVQRATPSLSKIKYYAVANGRVPGIYTDWPSTQKQVSGYPSARHKKFDTENEAWAFINANRHFVERAFQQKLDEASSQDECMSRQTPSSSPPPPYSSAPTPSWETSLQPAEDGPPSSPPEWISVQQNTAGSARFQDMPEDDYVPEPEPILTAEQRRVVDLIVDGQKNVFYTGSAGCGKSTILKAFVQKLKAQGKKVKIVAPTNLAALNVGGQTTWAYAGWTPDSMKKPLEQLKRSASGKQVWARFDQTDVLVIDEISMVENLQFERLNEIMKASLGNKNRGGGPFGGVQIVVTGDVSRLLSSATSSC